MPGLSIGSSEYRSAVIARAHAGQELAVALVSPEIFFGASMWKCAQCGEEIEDQFDSCWKCAGQRLPAGRPVMQCLRCKENMDYKGSKRFHEGGHFAASVGDLFVNRECFELYTCPKCGHVEFFVDLPANQVEQG
jgi:hypothetical protein